MTEEVVRDRIRVPWTWRPDGWWCHIQATDVRTVAQAMCMDGIRFAALTLCPEESYLRFLWHWDCGGVLYSAEARLAPGESAPSIVDLWPGADWAEREARDYYAASFAGREATPPLMLREGDPPGVLLRRDPA